MSQLIFGGLLTTSAPTAPIVGIAFIALFALVYSNISMALEEPKYKILKSNKNYEIRGYNDRLAVEVEYSNEDSGLISTTSSMTTASGIIP